MQLVWMCGQTIKALVPFGRIARRPDVTLRLAWLLSTAAVWADLGRQLDAAVCIQAVAGVAKRCHGAVANPVEVVSGDVDTPGIPSRVGAGNHCQAAAVFEATTKRVGCPHPTVCSCFGRQGDTVAPEGGQYTPASAIRHLDCSATHPPRNTALPSTRVNWFWSIKTSSAPSMTMAPDRCNAQSPSEGNQCRSASVVPSDQTSHANDKCRR